MFRICLVLALAVAVLSAGTVRAQDGHNNSVAMVREASKHPALSKSDIETIYSLTDQHSVPVGPERFIGRFNLIFFGYTACPDVCPTAMTHITSVMEKLGPLARYVLPVFVTFDPMRDTAEVLAEYVSHFDERILALTGTRSAIKAVQQRYGVLSISGPKSEDGSYFISHTAAKYLIGPDGTHVQSFSHEAPPEQIAGYLKNIFSRLGK